MASNVKFQRWTAKEASTWSFQVFQKYNADFERIFWSYVSGNKYVYSKLKESSAQWTDDVGKHFQFESLKERELFANLKDWSNAFNSSFR